MSSVYVATLSSRALMEIRSSGWWASSIVPGPRTMHGAIRESSEASVPKAATVDVPVEG